jgi:hypothetical protein
LRIANKAEFFQLWKAGVLGNRTNLWTRPEDALRGVLASGAKRIGFRQIGSAGGGAWEDCAPSAVFEVFDRWTAAGRKFLMDDGCPDHLKTFQGEICRTYRGLEGFFDTTARYPMRRATAEGDMRPYSGAMVNALLERFMDPSSRDDLRDLLDLYPDATVEFTCFSVDVGVYPNRNTIFWETRNY